MRGCLSVVANERIQVCNADTDTIGRRRRARRALHFLNQRHVVWLEYIFGNKDGPVQLRTYILCTAALPFSKVQATASKVQLEPFCKWIHLAKCMAISKPNPTWAPTATVVFPVSSAHTGLNFQNRSWINSRSTNWLHAISSLNVE